MAVTLHTTLVAGFSFIGNRKVPATIEIEEFDITILRSHVRDKISKVLDSNELVATIEGIVDNIVSADQNAKITLTNEKGYVIWSGGTQTSISYNIKVSINIM